MSVLGSGWLYLISAIAFIAWGFWRRKRLREREGWYKATCPRCLDENVHGPYREDCWKCNGRGWVWRQIGGWPL